MMKVKLLDDSLDLSGAVHRGASSHLSFSASLLDESVQRTYITHQYPFANAKNVRII